MRFKCKQEPPQRRLFCPDTNGQAFIDPPYYTYDPVAWRYPVPIWLFKPILAVEKEKLPLIQSLDFS